MNKFTQQGFSLIELMVGLGIGMVVVAGVTSVYVSTVVSSSDTLKQSKLNQELTTLMSVMANDIARAGAWDIADAENYNRPQNNPYNQINSTALQVIDNMTDNNTMAAPNGNGSCAMYSYDASLATTADNTIINTDVRGFRLNNGVVDMRQQGDTTNNSDCDNNNDVWEPVTDGRVMQITNLDFALTDSKCLNTREPNSIDDNADTNVDEAAEMNCYLAGNIPTNGSGDVTVETRHVLITLEGRLVNDANVTASLTQSVRVRNDLVRIR